MKIGAIKMAEKFCLTNFILHGCLGDLSINSSLQDLRRLLGQPDDVGLGVAKNKIQKFFDGIIQIAVKNELVKFIGVYFDRDVLKRKGDCPILIDIPENAFDSVVEFKEWVAGKGTKYKTRNAGEGAIAVEIFGGASVGFETEGMITVQKSG